MKRFAHLLIHLVWLPSVVFGVERMAQYRDVYERESSNIEESFRAVRLALPREHMGALLRLESHYQKEGDLMALLAVQRERQRFVLDPRAAAIPSIQQPEYLVQVSSSYRERYAAVGVDRQERLSQLQLQYRNALTRLQAELTRDGQIEEAQTVFRFLEKLSIR